jgi:hypothetical protein
VHGGKDLRRQAEAKVEEAKRLDSQGLLKQARYEERIRHRLETREIINRHEFLKRFPNGWKPSGEPKP